MIYLYKNIPGSGSKNWTLGIDAVGKQDAANYIRNVCHGGKFVVAMRALGEIPCDCMATTSARQAHIHENFERWMNETD